MIGRRPILMAVGIAAALVLATAAAIALTHPRVRKIQALDAAAVAWPEDTFRDGAWFADGTELPSGIATRGSRVDGNVAWRGNFQSGWFVAKPRVQLLVAGFPRGHGNALAIQVRDASGHIGSIAFDHVNPGECWRPWTVALPENTVAFRLNASDGGAGDESWLAFSEPFIPRMLPMLLPQTERTFLCFAVQMSLFLVLALAVWQTMPEGLRYGSVLSTVPLLATAGVALTGYLAFWIYFATPLGGRVFSWLTCIAAVAVVLRQSVARPRVRAEWQPVLLAIIVGFFYFALLLWYEPTRVSFEAANRFHPALPSDNEIPRAFAERLFHGESPRGLWGDWLSSDRPPLQVGWDLITWPVLQCLGFDRDTIANTAGTCMQLLWIPALWALFRMFGAGCRRALALVAAMAFSGLLLEYSVFVWPKLAAAAFVVGAFVVLANPVTEESLQRFAIAGVLAGLAYLCHGGAAFSILGVVPLVVSKQLRGTFRQWLLAGALFIAVVLPWSAYQRCYEPPGNRLMKMHLAGVSDIDDRGAWTAIRDSYRQIGWRTALQNKWSNLRLQFQGNWEELLQLRFLRRPVLLRASETTYTLRSCDLWLLGLAAAAICWLGKRSPTIPYTPATRLAGLWLVAGTLVWLALMFSPSAATIHQGSIVTPLIAFALLATAVLQLGSRWFVALATLQCAYFLAGWIPPSDVVEGTPQIGVMLIAAMCGFALLAMVWQVSFENGDRS